MITRGITFTEQGFEKLKKLVARQHSRIEAFSQAKRPNPQSSSRCWLGITVSDSAAYPSDPATKFEVKLERNLWDNTTVGNETRTQEDFPARTRIAISEDHSYIAEGTDVMIYEILGKLYCRLLGQGTGGTLPSVSEEGSQVVANCSDLNFAGALFTASDDGDGTATVTAAAATVFETGGSYELDGDHLDIDFTPSNYTPSTAPAEASNLDHLTAHLAGLDNAVASMASLSFTTIACPGGTNPVADSATDTLTLAINGASVDHLDIQGDSTADSVTFHWKGLKFEEGGVVVGGGVQPIINFAAGDFDVAEEAGNTRMNVSIPTGLFVRADGSVAMTADLDLAANDLDDVGAIYFGDQSTDNTYRIRDNGGQLWVEQRVAGSYVEVFQLA